MPDENAGSFRRTAFFRLHGLMRQRAFTQDDAHIFCSEDQITQECVTLKVESQSAWAPWVVATITSDADAYPGDVAAALLHMKYVLTRTGVTKKLTTKCDNIRCVKVPVQLVVGKREAQERTISVRRPGMAHQSITSLDETIAELKREIVTRAALVTDAGGAAVT